MAHLIVSRRLQRRFGELAVAQSRQEVAQAIEAAARMEIGINRDREDSDLCHAAVPFVPGSETVMVNGVHYYPEDYVLELDGRGNATGFIIELAEPSDDIHLVADPVEF